MVRFGHTVVHALAKLPKGLVAQPLTVGLVLNCESQDKVGLSGADVMPMMGAPMMGAPMPAMGAPAAGADGGAPQEEEAAPEKELWDLKLLGFDDKAKIKVIKEVRAISGLGLKEVRCHIRFRVAHFQFTCTSNASLDAAGSAIYLQAKELVEGAPKIVKKEMSKADAEAMMEKLKEVGAQVELE